MVFGRKFLERVISDNLVVTYLCYLAEKVCFRKYSFILFFMGSDFL